MRTIAISINDAVEEKFMWFLSHFKKDEIEILDDDFMQTKAYLHKQLDAIDGGRTKMLDIEEFDQKMEAVLGEYENKA